MSRSAVRTLLLSFAVPGLAVAQGQTPAPTPTLPPIAHETASQPPCPYIGSLYIDVARSDAFATMKREMTRDLTYHYAPEGKPYQIDLKFDGPGDKAKIRSLHYLFRPPTGVIQSLIERYGQPDVVLAPGKIGQWSLKHCGVKMRYEATLPKGGDKGQEELFVEPLEAPAPRK